MISSLQKLKEAGEIIEINVVDHVTIAAIELCKLKRNGLL
jgi:DNA repair protein RadC